MTTLMIDLIGWAGVILVLAAYGLMSISYMDGNSPSYQILNAAGAAMLVVNSVYIGAYPSVGVNAAWAGIALVMLWRLWWYKDQLAQKIKLPNLKNKRIHLPRQVQHAFSAMKNKPRDIKLAIQRKREEHEQKQKAKIAGSINKFNRILR